MSGKRKKFREKLKRAFGIKPKERESRALEYAAFENLKLAAMADAAKAAEDIAKDYGVMLVYLLGGGQYWSYWKERRESFPTIEAYKRFKKKPPKDVGEILDVVLANPTDIDFLGVFNNICSMETMKKIRDGIQEYIQERLEEIKKEMGMTPENYRPCDDFKADFEPRDVVKEEQAFEIMAAVLEYALHSVEDTEPDLDEERILTETDMFKLISSYGKLEIEGNDDVSKYIQSVLVEGKGILLYENQRDEGRREQFEAYRQRIGIRKVDEVIDTDYRAFIGELIEILPDNSHRKYAEKAKARHVTETVYANGEEA